MARIRKAISRAGNPGGSASSANFLNAPVSLVIAVSDYNLRVLAALGTISASRLRRIYNGADLARRNDHSVAAGAKFRSEHHIPDERILVTQVSWIIPEKGVPDVLEAARLALAREPSLHFAFVGDGQIPGRIRPARRRLWNRRSRDVDGTGERPDG